jgi:hypothetical protein
MGCTRFSRVDVVYMPQSGPELCRCRRFCVGLELGVRSALGFRRYRGPGKSEQTDRLLPGSAIYEVYRESTKHGIGGIVVAKALAQGLVRCR